MILYNRVINRNQYYRLIFAFVLLLVAMGSAIKGYGSYSFYFLGLNNCILPIAYFIIIKTFGLDLRNLNRFVVTLLLLILFQVLVFYKWGGNNILIHLFCNIFIAFFFARTLGIFLFLYFFEKTVVLLTSLSLILWGGVVVYPPLHKILVPYSLPCLQSVTDFTIGVFGLLHPSGDGLLRNTGFAWEPGRFASIIVLAILIHLYRNNFKLSTKSLWILLLGLASTQSTTGIMALSVCILGLYLNKRYTLNGLTKSLIGMGFVTFFILSPIMLDKIEEASDTDYWLTEEGAAKVKKEVYSPQRIESLALEIKNIKDSPLIGYGENLDCSYVRRVMFPYTEVFLNDGILQIIASIGIPLALLFYIALWKSSKNISTLYNVKGHYLFFLLLCLINFSYNLFLDPLIMYIALSSLFISSNDKILLEQQY